MREGRLSCAGEDHDSPTGSPVVDGGMTGWIWRASDYGAQVFSDFCTLDALGEGWCTHNSEYRGCAPVQVRYFAGQPVLALAVNPYTATRCAAMQDGSLWCASDSGAEWMAEPPGSFDTTCN